MTSKEIAMETTTVVAKQAVTLGLHVKNEPLRILKIAQGQNKVSSSDLEAFKTQLERYVEKQIITIMTPAARPLVVVQPATASEPAKASDAKPKTKSAKTVTEESNR